MPDDRHTTPVVITIIIVRMLVCFILSVIEL